MVTTELTQAINAELLRPEGEYEIRKIALRQELDPLVDKANKIIINDEESNQNAVDLGRVLVTLQKEIDSLYKPYKQSIDSIKSLILQDENRDLGRLKSAKELLGKNSLLYTLEQNRKRAEKEKIERELALKAEEERKLQEAIALEAEGNTQEAEEVLSDETLPVPVIIQSEPKPKGRVIKTTFYAEVENKKQLIEAVAAGNVPIEAVEINMSFLNTQAKAFRKGLNYPGVIVKEKTSAQFRS